MASSTGVTLVRDRWGIGHATAPDAAGAFWAQGWLAASDRIWQMEWDRRRALGRWAEVAGPAALSEDAFFRRLALGAVAEEHWNRLDAGARAMTEAYAAGVNAWLEASSGKLPPELSYHPAPPERWEPWHCVAVYHVRHLFMGSLYRKLWRGAVTVAAGPEVARAMVGDPAAAPAIVPGPGAADGVELSRDAGAILAAAAGELAGLADLDGGSNSWAVHGSRTASGKPLLAGDPHRALEFPNVYYQCHVACPGFDVIGLAFPGVPGFPHFGHNARVAWCITHGMADDTDVFVEHDPPGADRYETIQVHGGDPVTVGCASTERGPVVFGPLGSGQPVLSMMWTGLFGEDTTFNCLLPMLEAGTVDELEAAVAQWVVPVNNLLSADVEGDISFRLRGRIVERPAANRWTPVPGDQAHSWTGLEPVGSERLHAWRNPERGYLVTANNWPGAGGPYVSLDFARPSRHDRIVELLDQLPAATVDDMTAVHRDTRSLLAATLVARLGSARPQTAAGRRAQSLLQSWDGDLGAGSSAATVYSAARRLWSEEVGRRLGVLEVELGERGWPPAIPASRMLFDGASTLLSTGGWELVPGIGTEDDLRTVLGAVLDRVAAELAERWGPEPGGWAWSRVHTMVSPHPLAVARPEIEGLHPPVDGCPGDGDTVRCGSVTPHTGDRMAAGSVARYVFDLSDWDRSGWVVPHGVSGVRGSGHDLDQRPSWLAGELVPMAYSTRAVDDLAAATEHVPHPAN